jgi:predicted DNA-binding transcriptional regulator AlpA
MNRTTKHLVQIAGERGRLNTIENAFLARLYLHNTTDSAADDQVDELVDVRAAARLLGMSTAWIYKNVDHLPFARRVGSRTLRFSVRGIRRYQAVQQNGRDGGHS